MTPTPEDIALYNKLEAGIRFSAVGDYCLANDAAHVIAAHTAPLRELAEIGRLAVESQRASCVWVDDETDDQELLGRAQDSLDKLVSATRAYLAKHPTT